MPIGGICEVNGEAVLTAAVSAGFRPLPEMRTQSGRRWPALAVRPGTPVACSARVCTLRNRARRPVCLLPGLNSEWPTAIGTPKERNRHIVCTAYDRSRHSACKTTLGTYQGDVKMIAQAHRKVAVARPVEHGSTRHASTNPKAQPEEWAPLHPVDPRTHPAHEKLHTEWRVNGDRVGGLIAVSLFMTFVAFVAWVLSHGTPAGYDPTWDYMMWH